MKICPGCIYFPHEDLFRNPIFLTSPTRKYHDLLLKTVGLSYLQQGLVHGKTWPNPIESRLCMFSYTRNCKSPCLSSLSSYIGGVIVCCLQQTEFLEVSFVAAHCLKKYQQWKSMDISTDRVHCKKFTRFNSVLI